VAPAFVRPSRSGRVEAVEKAVVLMRFPVPWWAMADVCGREALYGDRLPHGLGRFRMVGTPVQTAEPFPKDLVADDKQRWWKGPRVSLATTAGRDGMLGASVAPSATPPDVKQASGPFAHDATGLEEEDAPHTVPTDGWQATPGAWTALCPNLPVLCCFLHALLTIRDRATKALGAVCAQGQERVWEAYHAPSTRALSPRVRRRRAWAETA